MPRYLVPLRYLIILIAAVICPVDGQCVYFDDLCKEVSSMHPTYACWIKLKNGYVCTGDFCQDDCPLPKENGNTVIFEPLVSPSILYKADTVQAWVMLKKELDKHIEGKSTKKEKL